MIVYNTTHKSLQFCDGDYWIAMGGGGSGGSGGGASGGLEWEPLDLADTSVFDTGCEYKLRVGTAWYYPHIVGPDYILFDAPIGEFKFGSVEKGSKDQFWYRSEANVATTSGTPVAIDALESRCAPDSQPDLFDFADVSGAAFATVVESDIVTVSGFNEELSVSISGEGGPEISIDGGAWTTSGTINAGQSLQLRLTSGNGWNVERTASVVLGDVTIDWSVGTSEEDTTPAAFSFADVTNANLSTLTTASAVTISGINASTPVSVSGGGAEISINGGGWVTSGNITNGQTLAVRLTSSGSYATAVTATVNVGGVTDSWSVTTEANCGGYSYGGFCYYYANAGQDCNSVCTSRGGCNLSGTVYLGSGASDNDRCADVLTALRGVSTDVTTSSSAGHGCNWNNKYPPGRRRTATTVCSGSHSNLRRACACNE